MSDFATMLPPFETPREPRVRLSTRLLVYFSSWLLVAVAFQPFLQPEGPTESALSPTQQRLLWPLYTPLMVVVGLVQVVTGPGHFPGWAPWVVVAGLAVHFIMAMTRARRLSFAAFTGIQILVLAVGVLYFVRQSHLPSGG